ncbi:T9SS type B sorting domain-containing protein [Spongiivirga citrea]|uniref:T9SS type B sorting domain-containing protein n=1 Tax=Spongiivirga citrea TaxID=1481457 RepID=A0A6M0CIH2_9FLAO|nr:T9SS type B sorting domain-containing protein [Spongiivirga citrea]NER15764.1 T9SS type B sorting domain-containing protein [Spongiivirga citrea]
MKLGLKKYIPFILFFCSAVFLSAQDCPTPIFPSNGATNVPIDATISWTQEVGVTGYIISLGTTPGGTDIVDRQPTGSQTMFSPQLGLPQNTQVYATISLFFLNRPQIVCATYSFTTEAVTNVPECATLSSPPNGAMGINIATNVSWNYVLGATGYFLTLETIPGTGNIANNIDVGNVLSYNPPVDFPNNTEIFVRITPYNAIGSAINCQSESFTTSILATPPTCAALISPANGETDVPLTPLIQWEDIADATGYRVSIGSSPFDNDILDEGVFTANQTLVIDFEPNRTFYITIIPFNDAGDAIGCQQQSFSTILGCGPFFDPVTNELIDFRPEIEPFDAIGICNGNTTTITTNDVADGFRWFSIDNIGRETLLSEENTIELTEEGNYRYEAYNVVDVPSNGTTTECIRSNSFTATFGSEPANITNIETVLEQGLFDLTIQISGTGDYEFSLDNIDGPYQDSNAFSGVTAGLITVYVRDKGGCGIVDRSIRLELPNVFPKFFTPNGDGFNDTWQYILPDTGDIPIRVIRIYDRFGRLLKEISPTSVGWDGFFLGKPLPSSDYWYQAITTDNDVLKGHFSLKR